MTDAPQPTYDKRKFWKLALLCVPACISGVSSYAKSRTEATDQAKATFEHIEADIDGLQADMLKYRESSFVLAAEVTVLKEHLADAIKRAEENRHWAAPAPAVVPPVAAPIASSIGSTSRRHPKPMGDGDDMDTRMMVDRPSFDSVVQAYKSKK